MIPGPFNYHAPASLDEAIGLLADLGEDARPLAGGHSLIPMMKLRLAPMEHLVDLRRIDSLKGIEEQAGTLVIGAMTTQSDLLASDLVAGHCPIIIRRADGIKAGAHKGLIVVRRCATSAPWAAMSPMATRPTTCRASCSASMRVTS